MLGERRMASMQHLFLVRTPLLRPPPSCYLPSLYRKPCMVGDEHARLKNSTSTDTAYGAVDLCAPSRIVMYAPSWPSRPRPLPKSRSPLVSGGDKESGIVCACVCVGLECAVLRLTGVCGAGLMALSCRMVGHVGVHILFSTAYT